MHQKQFWMCKCFWSKHYRNACSQLGGLKKERQNDQINGLKATTDGQAGRYLHIRCRDKG